jgi:hypothetical protein
MTVPFKGGAPCKYTPEELTAKIIEYFEYIEEENKKRKRNKERLKPVTITGMCDYMDILTETWCDYSKKQEYVQSIKKAKQKIETFVVEGLLNNTLNPIGAIFNLKNNFGWVDRIELQAKQNEQPLNPIEIKKQIDAFKMKELKGKSIDLISNE